MEALIAPSNTITTYQNNNTLVITDYANNLERIAEIIDAIDQPGANDPIVIPLKYASAVDVATTVNRLFAEAAQGQGTAVSEPTQRFAVVADARSNSLLARSGDPSRLARLRKFVAILDSPTNAGGNIHVVYLKNAEAVKLAEILRAIYQGEAGTPTGGTASGVHPVPLGFGRVYVHLPGGFSYKTWVSGLNQGRSFVTTGPMLNGVKFGKDMIETDTVVMRSVTGTVRRIVAEHRQLEKFHLD